MSNPFFTFATNRNAGFVTIPLRLGFELLKQNVLFGTLHYNLAYINLQSSICCGHIEIVRNSFILKSHK